MLAMGAMLAMCATDAMRAMCATGVVVVPDAGAPSATSAAMRLRNISGNLQIGCRLKIEEPRDAARINFDYALR
jgi:hypothetical protein